MMSVLKKRLTKKHRSAKTSKFYSNDSAKPSSSNVSETIENVAEENGSDSVDSDNSDDENKNRQNQIVVKAKTKNEKETKTTKRFLFITKNAVCNGKLLLGDEDVSKVSVPNEHPNEHIDNVEHDQKFEGIDETDSCRLNVGNDDKTIEDQVYSNPNSSHKIKGRKTNCRMLLSSFVTGTSIVPPKNICKCCMNIISLKDEFKEFNDSLTDDDKAKLVEVKQSLIEYEKTYNQELRVLLILARRTISWKYYLPVFSRRCISRNIENLKSHSDDLEQCLEESETRNTFEIIEIFDAHMEEKYLSLLSVYCENIGELRSMFRHQMKNDSDFLSILFSKFFQIERTLLPIHHLTYLQSLLMDLMDSLPPDSAMSKKLKEFDRKLSKMLRKCYEITTALHGLKYLRNIENLFPFDLNISTSTMDKISINNDIENDYINEHEEGDEAEVLNVKVDLDGKDDINLLHDLSKFIKNYKFDFSSSLAINDECCSESCENVLNDNEGSKSFDSNANACAENVPVDDNSSEYGKTSIELELLNDFDEMRCNIFESGQNDKLNSEMFSSNIYFKNKLLFNSLPFCYSSDNKGCLNKLYESFEMVDLSPISYNAGIRLRKERASTLSRSNCSYSLLNKTFNAEPIYQIYAESSLQSDGDRLHNETNSSSKDILIDECKEKPCNNPKTTNNYSDNVKGNETKTKECNVISQPFMQPQRTLWRDTSRVINEGVLENLSNYDLVLQESKYEILTSEVSYLKSLTILVAVFLGSPELNEILTDDDRDVLFKHVLKVKSASESFLYDLAGHFEADILMSDVYSIVSKHVSSTFNIYIDYCSNLVNSHNTLQKLLNDDQKFFQLTRALENSPECLGFSLDSFLLLPLQRVTRFPLLLQAIQKRLPIESAEIDQCDSAIKAVRKLAIECDEGAAKSNTTTSENINSLVTPTKKKISPDMSSKAGVFAKLTKFERFNSNKRWLFFSVPETKNLD